MSARLETHCSLTMASIAYSNSLALGLFYICTTVITAIPHPHDNDKMTFNNGFLVQGNGGQGYTAKPRLNITIIYFRLDSAVQNATFVTRCQMEKQSTIISVGVRVCFYFKV